MQISSEIDQFDTDFNFIGSQLSTLGSVLAENASEESKFFAEALAFRMYRATERLIRTVFLDSCVSKVTISGSPINSKLVCPNHEIAENILKNGRNFMTWGDMTSIRSLSNLVLENGFPITEIINPMNATIIDLQRIRNFIAHDSVEAEKNFEKVISNYLNPSKNPPLTAGELLLSRRNPMENLVIKKIHEKISNLSATYRSL